MLLCLWPSFCYRLHAFEKQWGWHQGLNQTSCKRQTIIETKKKRERNKPWPPQQSAPPHCQSVRITLCHQPQFTTFDGLGTVQGFQKQQNHLFCKNKKWRGNIRSFRENPVVEYIYFDDSSMSIVNTNGVSGKFGSCLWLSMFCAPPPPAAAPLVFFSSLALLNMTVNPSAEAGLFTSHSPNLGKGRPLSCCQAKSSHNHNHNQQCRFDYNHKIS